jgi:hypothetical protein
VYTIYQKETIRTKIKPRRHIEIVMAECGRKWDTVIVFIESGGAGQKKSFD